MPVDIMCDNMCGTLPAMSGIMFELEMWQQTRMDRLEHLERKVGKL